MPFFFILTLGTLKLASRQIEVHLSEVNIDEPQHDRWRQKCTQSHYLHHMCFALLTLSSCDADCNDIPVVHLNDKVLVRHRCSPEQLERAILSSLGQSKS